jgi:RNA polymerase sigma factor for flagellar operon FliA
MLDGVRTMGWYSRADHARYSAEERTNQLLQNLHDRESAAASQAGEPNATDKGAVLEQIADTLSQIATVHVVSLTAADRVIDEAQPAADDRLGDAQASARIRKAVAALPERERTLMEVYYFQGKSLEEAGAAIGLSKSWASRLHARAVAQLRSALGEA